MNSVILGAIITASVVFNNSNIKTSYMPPPAWFEVKESGEAYGELVNGVPFSQTNIANNYTRMQKFQIQDAWWYITDKGVIGFGEGISDLRALSIYLTL